MPAGSDHDSADHDGADPGAGSAPQLPHTWRPFGARMAATAGGAALVLVCLVAWWAFPPEVRAEFTVFQKLTMAFLFAIAFTAWWALVRSRVVATETGLSVVNGFRRRDLEYAEVVGITLPRGAPWATLDLADGTTISALAIQGSDGARAKDAVRQIRALLA